MAVITPGEEITGNFMIKNASGGVAADSTPEVIIVKNGSDTAEPTAISNGSVLGEYFFDFTVPLSWLHGDEIHARFVAQVNSVEVTKTNSVGTVSTDTDDIISAVENSIYIISNPSLSVDFHFDIKVFMESVLGHTAKNVSMTAANGAFDEAAMNVLYRLGITDLSLIDGIEEVHKVRMLCRVEAWRAVTESSVHEVSSSSGAPGTGQTNRGTIFTQAKDMLRYHEKELIQRFPELDPGYETVAEKQATSALYMKPKVTRTKAV